MKRARKSLLLPLLLILFLAAGAFSLRLDERSGEAPLQGADDPRHTLVLPPENEQVATLQTPFQRVLDGFVLERASFDPNLRPVRARRRELVRAFVATRWEAAQA